MALKL
jgi:hypothetical protein